MKPYLITVATLLAGLFSIQTAHAQLYVVNTDDAEIGKYNLDGTPYSAGSADFINAQPHPYAIQTDGTNLYIDSSTDNDIVEYTTSGTEVKAVVTGLSTPHGFIIIGSDAYVLNTGKSELDEYSLTTGQQVGTGLGILPSTAYKIASFGANLYITTGSGVSVYNTTTQTLNNGFIMGSTELRGVAVSGGDLFVTDYTANTVLEYDLTGKLITDDYINKVIDNPDALLIYNGEFYTGDYASQCVSVFNSDGSPLHPGMIKGLDDPSDLLILAPEPSTWALMLTGLVAFGFFGERRRNYLRHS
jgi:hypothetical protein